jgi:hypothetical protein
MLYCSFIVDIAIVTLNNWRLNIEVRLRAKLKGCC